MQREGKGNVKVLLIPPLLERNFECFLKMFDEDQLSEWFTFFMVKPTPRRQNGKVDYAALIQSCQRIIKEENITVLFANKEAGSLVASILCQEFPRISGPSVESVFLCNNRYYNLLHIDSRKEKLPYLALCINEDSYVLARAILSQLKLPCILQSCMGRSVNFARNRDELVQALDVSRKGVEHVLDMHKHLLYTYIDQRCYPSAIKPVILVRSQIDRNPAVNDSTWVGSTVEACVFQGKIIPWATANSAIVPCRDSKVQQFFWGYEMPSTLSSNLQTKLWHAFKADIANLIKRGFDNSFVYGEYKVFADGYMHLERMHGCVHSDLTPLYRQALSQGNNVHAALQLALQIKPDPPRLNGSYVLCHTMVVFESGKSTNLIRFDKALANSCVTLRYLYGQDIIIEPTLNHTIIGTITVQGTNFNACMVKIKEIRKEILKLPDLVPTMLGGR